MNLKKITLAILMISLMFTAGCSGLRDGQYVSPDLKNDDDYIDATETDTDDYGNAVTGTATNGDAVFDEALINKASRTDAISAYPDYADNIAGFTEGNIYRNLVMNVKITTDGDTWRLYDAEGVASATDSTVEDVQGFWLGTVSPYAQDISYCAIAYNFQTSTSVIVSYFNPSAYNIIDMSPEKYLKITKDKYEDAELKNVEYLGQTYALLDVPGTDTRGRQLQYVIEKDDLYFIITISLKGDTTLNDAVRIISTIY